MMEFHKDFFDQYGMLRPYRTNEEGLPEILDSGNPFIYTAYLINLLKTKNLSTAIYFNNLVTYYNVYIKNVKTISHDEMTGLFCSAWTSEIKINYSRCWYRLELLFYLHVKYNILGTLLLPLFFIKMILTCAIKENAKNGLPETDGPLQAWLICDTFNFRRVGRICAFFNKKHFGENWLHEMFKICFNRNEDHPCRLLTQPGIDK